MNKFVRYLIESIFDDSDNDIINDDDTLSDIVMKDIEKQLCKIVADYVFSDNCWHIMEDIQDKTVYSELNGDSISFYYNFRKISSRSPWGQRDDSFIDKAFTKKYVNIVEFYDYKELQKFIDILYNNGIKYVAFSIHLQLGGRYSSYAEKYDNVMKNTVDFHNIQFANYNLQACHPINITCNKQDIINNTNYFTDVIDEHSLNTVEFTTNNVIIDQDTTNIIEVDKLLLQKTFNIKDFLFVKKINIQFELNAYSKEQLASTYNFTGLPNGDYNININYRQVGSSYNYKGEFDVEDNKIINLIGIPNQVKSCKVYSDVHPTFFLHNFSFEGLTMELLPNFSFTNSGFPGKSDKLILQLGMFKSTSKWRRWEPTKPQYKTIIATKDWFLDCYLVKNGPHKKYTTPQETDQYNKEVQKEQKKIDDFRQKQQDAEEDLNKEIALVKKYIHKGDNFYAGKYWQMNVKDITDNTIKYNIYRIWNLSYNNTKYFEKTFSDFIQWLKHAASFTINRDSDVYLKDVIITAVEDERKQIIEQRKKDAKEQRKLERQKIKEENKNKVKLRKSKSVISKDNDTDEIINDTADSKEDIIDTDLINNSSDNVTNISNKNNDIHVIDYSDRALAIYGNTYSIKQQLKDLGCKYNKWLNINGKKQPGWIISKRKKSDIEKIINEV